MPLPEIIFIHSIIRFQDTLKEKIEALNQELNLKNIALDVQLKVKSI